MKTLIIGGTGFLSGAIVAECLRAGHDVSIVTRGSENRPNPPDGVTVLHADRSDADSLRTAVGEQSFDLVIDAILFRPGDARAAVDIFKGRTQRYVFISSDFVYGGEPRVFPLDEDTPRHATTPYGQNKAACEDVFFAAWKSERFPAVILRPPHIFGEGSLMGTGSRENRDVWLLYRMENQHPLFLIDGGAILIQPIHKTDIARACLAVAKSEKTPGRAYNTAGPECVTTRRYYEIIGEIAGYAPRILPTSTEAYLAAFPDRVPFAQNRCYSLARLRDDAQFAPTVGIHAALSEMVTALRAKGLPSGDPPLPDTRLADLVTASDSAVRDALRP